MTAPGAAALRVGEIRGTVVAGAGGATAAGADSAGVATAAGGSGSGVGADAGESPDAGGGVGAEAGTALHGRGILDSLSSSLSLFRQKMNTIPHTARGLEGVLAYCQLDGKAASARTRHFRKNADTALRKKTIFQTKSK
jgi:hypothetical protein